MAITWDQARTKVRGDLWRTGTAGIPDDVCDRALHAACQELERERTWLWLQNIKTSIPLEAVADKIAAPADFRSAQSICFQQSSSHSLDPPLEAVSLGRLRYLASQTSTGTPSAYCLGIDTESDDGTDTIYLDCEAPIGSIFEMVYTAETPDDLATAVAAGDSNKTLQKQQTAVIALACHYVALNYLRNEGEATRKLAVYQRILIKLEDRDNEQQGDVHGGCVVPDQTYQTMAGG